MASIIIRTESKDSGSLFQTCRLCLSEESVESVFDEEGLQQWISDYLSIEISSEDHLSQAVCSICRIQLLEFHQFRERCHEVQSALKFEIQTENCDSYKEKAIVEPSLASQADQILLESIPIQNAIADELGDITDIKIETHANVELTTSPDTDDFLNFKQAAEGGTQDTEYQQSFECEICHNILSSTAQMKSHERVVHGPKKFECVPCGLTFAFRTRYEVHLKTKRHIKKILDTVVPEQTVSIKEFQCNQCPASFSRKLQLDNHYCRSHKPRKFACRNCPKKYVSKPDLYRHIATDHTSGNDRPFECDICQKTFKVNGHLYEHKKRVHGPKRHRCDVCGSSFSTNAGLIRHVDLYNHIMETL